MALDDPLNYNYPVLFDGIAQMRKISGEIQQHVTDMEGDIGAALDSWTGDAADSYNGHANNLAGRITDMNAIVEALAKAVEDGAISMEEQDRLSSGLFPAP